MRIRQSIARSLAIAMTNITLIACSGGGLDRTAARNTFPRLKHLFVSRFPFPLSLTLL